MKTVLRRTSARRGMLYAPWPTDTSVSALPYKPLINYDTRLAFNFRSPKDFNPNEPVTDLVETVCIPAFDPQRSAAVQRGGVRPGAGA